MKQISSAKFISECGKIQLLCDRDTALGQLHDFLMRLKGEIVDRMIKAQKDEEAMAEAQKEAEIPCEEMSDDSSAS